MFNLEVKLRCWVLLCTNRSFVTDALRVLWIHLLSYSVRSQEGNLSGQQSYPSVLFILNDVA